MTMTPETMSPETFHDRYAEASDPPPRPTPVHHDLARGRRRLRRRRLGRALAAVAATAVIGAGTASVTGHATTHGVDPAAPPRTDAQLLQACRDGNQSAEATDLVFGAGTPRVAVAVRTDYQWQVAIVSADGRAWASCFVHLLTSEFASGMEVFPADGTSTSVEYGGGSACALDDRRVDPDCRHWFVSTVDRLPAAVAAVRYDLGDGSSQTIRTVDGFVVLNHEATLPDGDHLGTGGELPASMENGITQITYLDADGTPIASDDLAGGRQVPGLPELPPLSAYPSLRGAGVY